MFYFFKVILYLVVAGCAAGVVAQGPTDLTGAQWIWAGTTPAGGNYPVGNATFRRDYSPPTGRVSISANISIAADNAYTLYVNGLQIGDGGDYHQAEGYCVRLDPERNVFAVVAQNQALAPNQATAPNPAGLLAAIRIRFSDGLTDTIITDGGWRAAMGNAPAGFEQVAFDDSAWPAAFAQGTWPSAAPWDRTTPPDVNQDLSNLTGGKGKTNVGAIVGGVVGGVGGFIIIAGVVMWLRRRKHKALFTLEKQHYSVHTPFYPDLVDRSLASNAAPPGALAEPVTSSKNARTHAYYLSFSSVSNADGMSFNPPSTAGTLYSRSGPSQDLRSEMGQLQRDGGSTYWAHSGN